MNEKNILIPYLGPVDNLEVFLVLIVHTEIVNSCVWPGPCSSIYTHKTLNMISHHYPEIYTHSFIILSVCNIIFHWIIMNI
jgi:hypothetical protein